MIAHELAVRTFFVAPDIGFILETAARREFPFGFGRQALAGPLRVGLHVLVGEADHGVVHSLLNGGFRAFGLTPVGPSGEVPPRQIGAAALERVHAGDLLEKQRAAFEHFWRRLRELTRVEVLLGVGDIFGRVNESLELRVGDFRDIHPEAFDHDGVARRFLGVLFIGLIAAHCKFSALNPDHAGGRRAGGRVVQGQDDEGRHH